MDKSQEKKKLQLGMNPSTANGRLVKDLLWQFIVDSNKDKCFRCNKVMTRDTFSIDHLVPWLDSENPLGLYFDLQNIGFSHKECNISAARKPHKKYEDASERKRAANKRYWERMGKEKQQSLRREKYEKYGC